MRNVQALNPASGELNTLLSIFSGDTDREFLEIAVRSDSRGRYQLMDKSPLLPEAISRHALNLGLRLGFCKVLDRIGQTLIMRVVAPHHAVVVPGVEPTTPNRGKSRSAF